MSYGIYNKTLKRWVKEFCGGVYIDIVRSRSKDIEQELRTNAENVKDNSQHMYDEFVIADYEKTNERDMKIKKEYFDIKRAQATLAIGVLKTIEEKRGELNDIQVLAVLAEEISRSLNRGSFPDGIVRD